MKNSFQVLLTAVICISSSSQLGIMVYRHKPILENVPAWLQFTLIGLAAACSFASLAYTAWKASKR